MAAVCKSWSAPAPEGGLVITYHDVSDLRRASAEIEHLAFYDPLTGLPNRRLLLTARPGHRGYRAHGPVWGAPTALDLLRAYTLPPEFHFLEHQELRLM